MRLKCVCCVARSAPTLQFVMSVRSTVLNVLRVLRCQKRSNVAVCDECKEHCTECIGTHTCGTNVVC